VLCTVGGVYEVALDDGDVVAATLPGRLKLEQRTGDRVVAGDRVQLRRHRDGHAIEAVEERHSQLARRAPGRGSRRAKVIIANVDQVVAVFAAARPEPHLRMLDRFLVLAEANALPAIVILNKTDLVEGRTSASVFAAYERAGYLVLRTSVKDSRGLDAVREQLCGRRSVLTGPSGVGKSSLLNAIQPGLGLRVAEVSEAALKGRHTTVAARMIPLDCGGFVADTPGLRQLGLWGIDAAELPGLFPEFRPYVDACRFGSSCTHTHEPRCAVHEAVDRGAIERQRYESYLAMMQDE
jgi:ribosome biogenesis GTPase